MLAEKAYVYPNVDGGKEFVLATPPAAALSLVNAAPLRCLGDVNPYPTAFPYGNGMVLHFYQQQESSTTKTVHKVINKRLKTYV